MTICFFREQALLWSSGAIQSFTIDMNYKHLAESSEKEIILAWETLTKKGQSIVNTQLILD
jgi:hypothetical protein